MVAPPTSVEQEFQIARFDQRRGAEAINLGDRVPGPNKRQAKIALGGFSATRENRTD